MMLHNVLKLSRKNEEPITYNPSTKGKNVAASETIAKQESLFFP